MTKIKMKWYTVEFDMPAVLEVFAQDEKDAIRIAKENITQAEGFMPEKFKVGVKGGNDVGS